MYKPHQYIKDPKSKSDLLWRYFDFVKFMFILKRKQLFFPSVAMLHDDDPFEGSLPAADYKIWNDRLNSLGEKDVNHAQNYQRKEFCISCWHYNDKESLPMWKLYSQMGNGIAIQTTFQDFKESFKYIDDIITAGAVTYIDYEKESFFKGKKYNVEGIIPFFHKRSIYEYEHEYRAIIRDVPSPLELFGSGRNVPIILESLIKKVIVGPLTPEWIFSLVKNEMAKELPSVPIEHSTLYTKPLV
jgi:hypothetical protein